ncbi:MAG TPA: type II toxin-antitoxin system VapC family toxin [Acetobacteraceae bacterium]|nr:type II toxin-antitoxin system VapC family toxin [Acetobacteraceae bacterium]
MVAILQGKTAGPRIATAIETCPLRLLSAANLLETSIVIEALKGEAGERELDLLVYRAGIDVVTVDRNPAETTRTASRRFRKGRHAHPLATPRIAHICPVKSTNQLCRVTQPSAPA